MCSGGSTTPLWHTLTGLLVSPTMLTGRSSACRWTDIKVLHLLSTDNLDQIHYFLTNVSLWLNYNDACNILWLAKVDGTMPTVVGLQQVMYVRSSPEIFTLHLHQHSPGRATVLQVTYSLNTNLVKSHRLTNAAGSFTSAGVFFLCLLLITIFLLPCRLAAFQQ